MNITSIAIPQWNLMQQYSSDIPNTLNPAYIRLNGMPFKRPAFPKPAELSSAQQLAVRTNAYFGYNPVDENPDLDMRMRQARTTSDYINRRGRFAGTPQSDIEGLESNLAVSKIVREELANPGGAALSKQQIRDRIEARIQDARLETDPMVRNRDLAITKNLTALYLSGDLDKIINIERTGDPIDQAALVAKLEPILKARLFLLLHLGDLKRSKLYNVKLHWLSKTIDF